MDMRNILDKIKQIESRQNLMEDSQPSQPVGQHTQQVVPKNTARPDSIFSTLVREFGYDITEADAPAQPAKRNLFQKIGDLYKQNAANLAAQQQAEADMAKPENIAAFKASLTPSQLKWASGVDLSDPIIRARIPKPQPGEKPAGTPVGGVDDEGNVMPGFTQDEQGNVVKTDPNFVEPATQKLAQQGRQAAKEKQFAASQDQADADMGKAMTANAQAAREKEFAASQDQADADLGQAMTANAAGGPSSVNAQGQNVTTPAGINPETGEKYDSVANAPLQLPPGAAPEPGMTVAGGAAAKPSGGAAKPAASSGGYTVKPGDNLTKIAKANNTTVDAIMKANPQITDPNKIMAGGKLSLPGGAAKPAAPQKGPNGEPAVKDPRTGKMGYMKRTGRTAAFVPFPEAGGAAKPAPAALPGKAVPGAGNISDVPMPESNELARIKSLISYRW